MRQLLITKTARSQEAEEITSNGEGGVAGAGERQSTGGVRVAGFMTG